MDQIWVCPIHSVIYNLLRTPLWFMYIQLSLKKYRSPLGMGPLCIQEQGCSIMSVKISRNCCCITSVQKHCYGSIIVHKHPYYLLQLYRMVCKNPIMKICVFNNSIIAKCWLKTVIAFRVFKTFLWFYECSKTVV